jgi:cellobiose epimerase
MLGLEKHLKSVIIPFWQSLKDHEHGGYYGFVDHQLNIDRLADKSLVATARYLYAFSIFYAYFKEESYLIHARHSLAMLLKFQDELYGGFHWMLSYDGSVKSSHKHVYGHAFAIYALAAYYEATKDVFALDLALSTFELIEKHAHLGKFCYHEEFSRDWQKKDNELLSAHGQDRSYTTNTLLHLMEAYTGLYKVSGIPTIKDRVYECILGFKETLYCPKEKLFHLYFNDQCNVVPRGQSFGHDIEACWLLDEAMKSIAYVDLDMNQILLDVEQAVLEKAMTKEGLISEVIDGQVNAERVWWIQAEAMVGFMNHYEKTNDITYLQAIHALYTFTMKTLYDGRASSEWLWGVDCKMKPIVTRGYAGPWKAPYHSGRALIELLKRGLE